MDAGEDSIAVVDSTDDYRAFTKVMMVSVISIRLAERSCLKQ